MSAKPTHTVETPNGTILEVGSLAECQAYVREYGMDPSWIYECEVRPAKRKRRAHPTKKETET